MIKIFLAIFALTELVLPAEENFILTEARELRYSVILGKVRSVDTSKPVVIVSKVNDVGESLQKGFFRVEITIEEEIYNYEKDSSFASKLPDMRPKTKEILIGSRSIDPNVWAGPAIGEMRVFFVGRTYLGFSFQDVSIGSLEPSEVKDIKQKIAESIYKQMEYTRDWMKWNLD